jgi:DNA invertase Pin-like site-specific DNA recombinase
MNVIIYCRVSSKEQIDGTSLESQEASCRDFAQAKDMHVLKVFIERGESAKFADRTALLALIDFCREHKGDVNALLVWKIDRFARNVADHYSIKGTLQKYGVRVVSVTEPIDSDPTGKLMEGVLASVAQFDNDIRAMRTVQGMRRRIQEGIFPWGPPLGYRSSVTNGEKKNQPDAIKEPEFTLLKRAWTYYASGFYTQAEIGRMLDQWGVKTSRGGSTLSQMFTNAYYKGAIVDPWSGEEFDGRHAPMVTKEQFARVQSVIRGTHHSVTHAKEHPDFPLRGFVQCEKCFHPLTGALSRGRSGLYPYYVCQAASCERRGKSHRAEEVNGEFEGFLDWVAPHPIILGEIAVDLEEEVLSIREESQAKRENIAARREKLERELQGLVRMRTRELINDSEFLTERKRVREKLDACGTKILHSTVSVAEVRSKAADITTPLVKLRQTWKSIPMPHRRRFERLILPAGFVVGHSRTAQLGSLFRATKASVEPVSAVVSHAERFSNQILADIQAFWDCLKGVEVEENPSRRRFECSHRRYRSA